MFKIFSVSHYVTTNFLCQTFLCYIHTLYDIYFYVLISIYHTILKISYFILERSCSFWIVLWWLVAIFFYWFIIQTIKVQFWFQEGKNKKSFRFWTKWWIYSFYNDVCVLVLFVFVYNITCQNNSSISNFRSQFLQKISFDKIDFLYGCNL